MSAEEVALKIRAIEGVKTATAKTSKKGVPSVTVSYTDTGLTLLDLKQTIQPEFENGLLQSVNLNSTACVKLAMQKVVDLRPLISSKYGPVRTQREVTADRRLIAIRDTYATTATRVVVRIEEGARPEFVPEGSGSVGKMLSSIANSSVQSEIDECPADGGIKGLIQITYMNNAVSTIADDKQRNDEAAKIEREKDKL